MKNEKAMKEVAVRAFRAAAFLKFKPCNEWDTWHDCPKHSAACCIYTCCAFAIPSSINSKHFD